MPHSIRLTQAAAVLQETFGPRLEAAHDDGMRLMADAVRERFSLSSREAREVVHELEQARSIRWHSHAEPQGGWQQAAPVQIESGYWQL
jgi:hypothetical protein